jgi:hypothetical protein
LEDRLAFGKIHIIEWLKPANRKTGERGERRTGKEIYEELRPLISRTSAWY